jgi:hypothetical protein
MSLETIAPLSDDPIVKLPRWRLRWRLHLPVITTASPLLHHSLGHDLEADRKHARTSRNIEPINLALVFDIGDKMMFESCHLDVE